MTQEHKQDNLAVLQQQLAELQTANRELTHFASSVAHDLRNPLTDILCVAGLLAELPAISGNPVARDMANHVLAGAKKMHALIEDYLAFFKAGRHELKRKPVSLESLLDLVRHELEPLTASRDIVWQVGPLPTIPGDASMLRQAFLNLISNALKFTRTQAKTRIEIGAVPEADAGHAIIYVRDNGIGFEPGLSVNLFKSFERLHDDERFEGSGVGLIIVHHIIQRHGGKVWAEGEPGKGAIFYVALPLT